MSIFQSENLFVFWWKIEAKGKKKNEEKSFLEKNFDFLFQSGETKIPSMNLPEIELEKTISIDVQRLNKNENRTTKPVDFVAKFVFPSISLRTMNFFTSLSNLVQLISFLCLLVSLTSMNSTFSSIVEHWNSLFSRQTKSFLVSLKSSAFFSFLHSPSEIEMSKICRFNNEASRESLESDEIEVFGCFIFLFVFLSSWVKRENLSASFSW